ncbi:MAG: hypothetical protein ONB05_07045 [candidate division KSB1 bacterium]|nr:hypothetical protein [candidate division KSB1 bacterium]
MTNEGLTLTGPIWLMQPIPYFGEELKEGWIYEPKIDGWRMQLIKYADGRTECWGRRLERQPQASRGQPNWTEKLPDIIHLAREILPAGTLLDTELYSSGGRQFIPSVFAAHRKADPIVFVFDAVFFENTFVGNLPLEQRRSLICGLPFRAPFYLVDAQPVTDLKTHLAQVLNRGHEGIVVKKLSSPYQVGKEAPIATEHWRKIKPVSR